MYTHISAAALFAGLAAAYHAPVGNPTGNPITRPLNEIVPACKDFTITWQPTTTNKVALVLLKGPSTNVVPVSAIVENIDNSGSFTWSVPAGLEATTDATGYGLQIIDEVNGQYQYSTQFGINNDACKNQVSSTPSTPSSTPAGYSVSTPAGYPVSTPAETKTSTPAGYPVSTPAAANSTTLYTATSKPVVPPVYSTGAPVHNSSIVLPTKSMSIPSSLQYSATGSVPSGTATPPPESTGAASSLKAGLGLAGAVAGLVFML